MLRVAPGNIVMAHRRRGNARVIVAISLVVLAGAGAVAYVVTRPGGKPDTAQAPATAPATTQSTRPATRGVARAPKPKPPTTRYLDVVRSHYPRMPETQPLSVPIDLAQAARVTFTEPVYLSPRGDLWITRPDAPPTPEVLARAVKEQGDQLTLATRERVMYAHWIPNEKGPWTFTLVVRGADGGDEIVTQSGRAPIKTGRSYHWDRALEWNDKTVVSTTTGVSVVQWEPQFREVHCDLIDPKAKPDVVFADPQFLLDWEGVLAWVPWDGKKVGSVGAARFVQDRWSPLGPEQGWPDKLLHLVPLYDGGVLQLVPSEEEWVKLAFTSLEKLAIDEALVAQLVEKLSDPEDKTRQDAFKELTRYGPSAWPVLEKLMPDQGPEAQARLKQLLKDRVEPTLGGMSLLGDKLKLVARLSDGGAVFYAEVGVAVVGDGQEPVIRSPAWISIRPGQAITLLDAPFTTDLVPDRSMIYAFGDEWVVTTTALGPQRFVGNGFVSLLRKSEAGFSEPIGIDRRGRWLFRRPRDGGGSATTLASTAPSTGPATTSTSAATAAIGDGGEILVLDPTIPDPTPRLPVWIYSTAETVGWDRDNWPAVKRGGSWALHEEGWRPMKRTEKLYTSLDEFTADVPAAAGGGVSPKAPASAPASTPSTTASTAPTTATAPSTQQELGPLLLRDGEGNRYYDGRTTLHIVTSGGEHVVWPLPATATGNAEKVHLARTADGLIFIWNQPGRILRIRPTPDEPEPFVLEATFTRNVPNADSIARLWVDPSGRLIMAYGSKLAIMFPQGYIPPAIASKIPPGQMDTEE
jgi:hypothetical protein